MSNPLDNIPNSTQEQWHQNLTEQNSRVNDMKFLWAITSSEQEECEGCSSWSDDEQICDAFDHNECPAVIRAFNLNQVNFQ